MNAADLEKPLRLTRGFWITYAVLALPVVWIALRALAGLPAYAQIAGILFFPFAAAIVGHCSFHVIAAAFTGTQEERRHGRFLLIVVVLVVGVRLAARWLVDQTGHSGLVWSVVAVAGLFVAILSVKRPTRR
jgi:hypothetical protein